MPGNSDEPDVVAMVSYDADGNPDQSEGFEVIDDDADAENGDETEEKPKRRGRPRKVAVEEATTR